MSDGNDAGGGAASSSGGGATGGGGAAAAAASGASSTSHHHHHGINWRHPTPQHMQKYGLVPLPDDFEPTAEERQLLDMYNVIKSYERQGARLKEEAARARLAARDAEFQQKKQENKQKKKKKIRIKRDVEENSGDEDDDDDDDLDDASDDDDEDEELEDDEEEEEDEEEKRARREAKLEKLREEVEDARQTKEAEEAALREKHLSTAGDNFEDDEGPSLKRKRVVDESKGPKSLIANMTAAATPPHDFSEKLGLSVTKGKVLFPRMGEDEASWQPPEGVVSPNDGAFFQELEKFDVAKAHNGIGNNTLAIKFMAPQAAKRFSINIAAPDHNDFDSILFHFNPRQRERGGQLVVNDKQEGIWGQAVQLPLSQCPLMFGQTSCTLIIQINGDGFDIFIEDKHCARLEHRKPLPTGDINLILQFPSTDDYGKPENWMVFKVWWGNKPVMHKADVSNVPGVNSYNALHPRKLFCGGLTKIYSEPEVDLRRAELERAFRKYGGDRGVTVVVPTGTTYAFVEMESERQTDLALSEMSGQYRLNRARRSKHEALQEERAAKEAAKKGGHLKKDNKEWD